MAIFNSYVKLPEGIASHCYCSLCHPISSHILYIYNIIALLSRFNQLGKPNAIDNDHDWGCLTSPAVKMLMGCK